MKASVKHDLRFEEICASVDDAVRSKWDKAIDDFYADPSNPDPFAETEKGI